MKVFKRTTCFLLCLAVCLCLFPAALAAGETEITPTLFTDPVFLDYVEQTFDTDGNGQLSAAEIKAAKVIDVMSMDIGSLNGLEVFTYAEELYCAYNRLTELDVTKNTRLTVLSCYANELTALDVSRNKDLKVLHACMNSIGQLDIHAAAGLMKAYAEGNKSISNMMREYAVENSAGETEYYLTADPVTAIRTSASVEAPAITAQPKTKAAASGKTVTFTVTAQGQGLKYQWYYQDRDGFDWIRMGGKTSAKLSVTAKASKNGWRYRCEVTGDGGSVCTEYAALRVVKKPAVTLQPGSVTVKAGKKVTFKVKASGGCLSFQWYYQKKGTAKWVKIDGARSASCSFIAKKSFNGRQYRCLVKNAAGKVYSKAVKLTVK